jgi:hypothetical protein
MTITLTREEAQSVLDDLVDILLEERTPAQVAVIKFLRARLSAPEPSIVEDAIVYGTGITMGGNRIDPASIYKQPEPEPVAWMNESDIGRTDWKVWAHGKPTATIPLYAAECMPDDLIATYEKGFADGKAKSEWQGLTDEEIKAVYGKDLEYQDGDYARYARAIEAKLKEKNRD